MTNRQKAEKLLQQMTLTEKVGQLAQRPFGFEAYTRDEKGEIVLTQAFKDYVLRFGGLGMLCNYFRADPWSKRCYQTGGIVASEREKAYNLLQRFVIENTRLGIPVLMEEDAPHGRQILDSVMYPVSLNVGCTFNPALYQQQAREIGLEAKIGGVNVPYLSVFDIASDPRWGRFEECFSEDPYLASRMAESAVIGMHEAGNMVCCKHYLAQGSAVGAHNGGVSNIGEREVREIHLPPVEAAVKAGCEFIMATYSEIDGEPCHASSYYLRTVLRDELGFDGVVRSDGCAVDQLEAMCGGDLVKAGALAVRAGVDCGLWGEAMTHLEEAVEKGYITESEIDDAVCRLLEKKYECGLMDKPYLDENGQSVAYLQSEKGQAVAYEMACESLVLLKNQGVLPLQKQRVLLIGGNLDNIYYQLGDYTPEQKGAKTVKDIFVENGAAYLQGWTFEDGITVSDSDLAAAVLQADLIVFGCGGSSVRDFDSIYNGAGAIIQARGKYMDCGEGCDLAELKLKSCQIELLEKLSKFDKPIVSLVVAGRAYVLTEVAGYSDALVWCGYSGGEGARAIYDTLYGVKNSFGRLSFSLPKSVGQLPIYYNSKRSAPYVEMDDKPLYAFGYGLSYADFSYDNFTLQTVSLDGVKRGEKITLSFDITNHSDRAGMEIPQLYIHKNGGTITHRLKELKGFEKVGLGAGETKRVVLSLGFDELKEWSVRRRYELLPCALTVMLGRASNDIVWQTKVAIE
jgi:beta-glucosidase